MEPSTIQSTTASLLHHANTSTPTPDSSSLSSLPLRLLTSTIHALEHVDTFAFQTVPGSVGRITGISSLWSGAGPTSEAGSTAATHAVADMADMAGSGLAEGAAQEGSYYFAEFLVALKKLGGFFGYLTSIWSFACLLEVNIGP